MQALFDRCADATGRALVAVVAAGVIVCGGHACLTPVLAFAEDGTGAPVAEVGTDPDGADDDTEAEDEPTGDNLGADGNDSGTEQPPTGDEPTGDDSGEGSEAGNDAQDGTDGDGEDGTGAGGEDGEGRQQPAGDETGSDAPSGDDGQGDGGGTGDDGEGGETPGTGEQPVVPLPAVEPVEYERGLLDSDDFENFLTTTIEHVMYVGSDDEGNDVRERVIWGTGRFAYNADEGTVLVTFEVDPSVVDASVFYKTVDNTGLWVWENGVGWVDVERVASHGDDALMVRQWLWRLVRSGGGIAAQSANDWVMRLSYFTFDNTALSRRADHEGLGYAVSLTTEVFLEADEGILPTATEPDPEPQPEPAPAPEPEQPTPTVEPTPEPAPTPAVEPQPVEEPETPKQPREPLPPPVVGTDEGRDALKWFRKYSEAIKELDEREAEQTPEQEQPQSPMLPVTATSSGLPKTGDDNPFVPGLFLLACVSGAVAVRAGFFSA